MTVQRFVHVNRANAMLVAFVGLLVAASAGATPTRATSRLVTPRTLFIEQGTIHKFAQDGDRIAWVGGRHYDVHLRGVSKRRGWLLGHAGPGGSSTRSASTLVLGGTRAVWVEYAGFLNSAGGHLPPPSPARRTEGHRHPERHVFLRRPPRETSDRPCRQRRDDPLRRGAGDVLGGHRRMRTHRWRSAPCTSPRRTSSAPDPWIPPAFDRE